MSEYGYGLWALAAIDSLLVITFAVSFFHPQGRRDWRTLGGFAAFVVALFSEMWGSDRAPRITVAAGPPP
jgi:hypothetical protein